MAIGYAPTRYPNGVTNVESNSVNAGMIQPDPTLLHTYFNDFNDYTAADWVVTETQGGATQALTAGDGGLLLLTNTATDDDLNELQKTPAAFAFTATKRAWFSARFKASDVTQNDIMFGIVIVNTAPFATPPTDGIYFLSSDGAATVDVIVRKNATTGSNSKTAIATLVNDTYVNLQWYYNGDGRLFYGVNGALSGSLDASSTYLPDATNLTVTMAIQAGEAGAETMTIDYVMAMVER